jgi:hypothetical protein
VCFSFYVCLFFKETVVLRYTEYLTNVLDDLDLATSETLTQIETLLKAGPEEFFDKAEVMPQRLVHTIATMRGIEA